MNNERKKSKGEEGKKFELDIKQSFENQHLYIQRLKDSRVYSSTNPGDFITYNVFNNKLLYLECKSTKDKKLIFGSIQEHQIKDMYSLFSNFDYIDCYFIINFREVEETYGLHIKKVYDFYYSLNDENKNNRRSFPYEYVKENGIKINGQKKRVRFNYDLYNFMYETK